MKLLSVQTIKIICILFLLISVFPNRVNASADTSFYSNLGTGFNAAVSAMSIQSDGKILVGGSFTALNGNTRNRLVRLNSNGTEDASFYTNLGSGFDGLVNSISIQSDGKILVGGFFTSLDGDTRNYLVRLNSDGTEDGSFYTNLGTGFDDRVHSISIQSDGKILVGGVFTTLDGNDRARLVRLNSDGTEDTSFYSNLGTGFNNQMNSISIQSDGKILVGGVFTTLDGNDRARLIRLNSDGTEDTSFYSNLGTGFNVPVSSTVVQSDGKILVGGVFTNFNGNTRNYLVRLNSDGTEDSSFYTNLGSGFNAAVSAMSIQSDGKILIGGYFNTFKGNTRNLLVRLNSDGTEDTFFYTGLGSGFNIAGLNSAILTTSIQSDGKILVGGSFTALNGNTRNRFVRLGPSVIYSGNFSESEINDGSVTGSRVATLNGDTFNSTLTEGVHYNITNKPAGLTAVVTRTSGTVATLTLTGNAVDNGSADSVSDLTITWLDGAFTITSTSSLMSGYTDNTGSIQFVDQRLSTDTSGTNIVLTYNEELDSESLPVPDDFYVLVNGNEITVDSVGISGTTVTLGVSPAILIGDNVTLTYYPGEYGDPIIGLSDFNAGQISAQNVTNNSTVVRPGLSSLSTNTDGTNIFLTYNVELDSESLPVPDDFYVLVNGNEITVESVTISGTIVTLVIPPAIFAGDEVTLSYYPEQYGSPIIGLTGFYADEFEEEEVTNNSTVERPGLSSLSTNTSGTNIVLTYNVELDSESLPLPEDFQVRVNGNGITVESVSISGTTVTLIVSPAIFTGDTVALYYYPENYGAPIVGLSDFYAEEIDGQNVTNNSNVAPPGLSSISTNTSGTNIVLTYNVELDSESLPLPEDFEINVNGDPITIESVNISGTTVTLVVSPAILTGDTIELYYYPEEYGYPIIGLSDFYADEIDGQAVTNNVQPAIVPTPTPPQTTGSVGGSSSGLSTEQLEKMFGKLPKPQATSTATSTVVNNQNNTKTPNNTTPVSFTRNLQLNSRGEDVRNLQRFLNQNGFSVSASGAGSPGRETNLFGPATRRALIRYQQANNIRPAIGFFGPVTRAMIKR
jgi:uncharacterized repeat protein (TIGR02059 family)/uncharacterized delta-60 repeat protein